jgi:hypothetical protein
MGKGNVTKANCAVCEIELGKTAMKNHILKAHCDETGELCYLLKIEGAYNQNYWLIADIALDKSLSALDLFLRDIWLECCGHLSRFYAGNVELGKSRKLGSLTIGAKFIHEYDFGSTTETLITVIAQTHRPKQRVAVRLLARNIPPNHTCVKCGKPAEHICLECPDSENPFFCDKCSTKHEKIHVAQLPVTNSPRMGVCGYCG